jgi:hypothetical protein
MATALDARSDPSELNRVGWIWLGALTELTTKAPVLFGFGSAAGVCCPVLPCVHTEGLLVVVQLCHLWLGSLIDASFCCHA